uniref:apocytochrome b n=1 Tax=Sargassum graminifolium TaxID=2855562 RepID=UPI002028C6CF|nr:apocytochrome b [Sargassum graminifolium]UQV81018.1 apocytochrome b [Sargassum graminifolium]
MTRWNLNAILSWVDSHIIDYPTAMNLNYNWSFGSTAGFCLLIQILSGAFLAMHYASETHYAFSSVEHIMRDVKSGWLIRYMHANGASFFFMLVYAHIFRGLYYGSYMEPRQHLWWSGTLIYVLMMATAFIGYVLPWGQMSFWGATVITSFFSIIPVIGKEVVMWIWGGFTVGNPTLNRFYSLHYLLPFLITGMVFVHLGLLHKDGSNNPLGIKTKVANINFYPYIYVKDLVAFFALVFSLSIFVFYFPNALGEPDNYLEADPYSTPAHIVPEWYFLPFYAILRVIPNKVGGILAMGGAIVMLFLYPLLNTSILRSGNFRPVYAVVFWVFVADFCLLGWAGTTPVDDYFRFIGITVSVGYFSFFIFGGLFVGWLEKLLMLHAIKMDGPNRRCSTSLNHLTTAPSYKVGVVDYLTPRDIS